VPNDRFDRSTFLKAAGAVAMTLPAAPALAFGHTGRLMGPQYGRTVLDVIEKHPDLSILAGFIESTPLSHKLRQGGLFTSWTVFAPTNNAFGLLPGNILKLIESNPLKLLKLLEHTIIPEALGLLQLLQLLGLGGLLQPLIGPELHIIKRLERVFIDEAQIIVPNLGATNGVVHIIDGVLLKGLGL
jgi:transforming growth factor-beta-induced protein